ncbi:Conserved_hypothetical protein [Hexamita inflata]|uniref:Uncharacterized protein n=1 Tax=Hexamita inflata TaxID=28002 RepID=A0ABP1H9B8_9EUKA
MPEFPVEVRANTSIQYEAQFLSTIKVTFGCVDINGASYKMGQQQVFSSNQVLFISALVDSRIHIVSEQLTFEQLQYQISRDEANFEPLLQQCVQIIRQKQVPYIVLVSSPILSQVISQFLLRLRFKVLLLEPETYLAPIIAQLGYEKTEQLKLENMYMQFYVDRLPGLAVEFLNKQVQQVRQHVVIHRIQAGSECAESRKQLSAQINQIQSFLQHSQFIQPVICSSHEFFSQQNWFKIKVNAHLQGVYQQNNQLNAIRSYFYGQNHKLSPQSCQFKTEQVCVKVSYDGKYKMNQIEIVNQAALLNHIDEFVLIVKNEEIAGIGQIQMIDAAMCQVFAPGKWANEEGVKLVLSGVKGVL